MIVCAAREPNKESHLTVDLMRAPPERPHWRSLWFSSKWIFVFAPLPSPRLLHHHAAVVGGSPACCGQRHPSSTLPSTTTVSPLPKISAMEDAAGSNLLAPKRSCGYMWDKRRQSQASSDGRLRWEKPYFRLIVPTDAYTQVQGEERDINLNIPSP